MEIELISVIVPTFNIEKYISRCVESIIAQTYQNLEIILVDDGSTDDSGHICDMLAENDKRIIVIHQQNQGLAAARNSGMEIAKGKYLMYVDGDDYLHTEAISTMHHFINQNGERYDIAIIDRKETARMDEDVYAPMNGNAEVLSQDELITNMFTHPEFYLYTYQWNKLYRRELIDNIRVNAYTRVQDFDFNLRVFFRTKNAILIHRKLYFYVQRTTSAVHTDSNMILHYQCRVEILFRNYVELPAENRRYAHFILRELYLCLVILRKRTLKTQQEERYRQICKNYERTTLNNYLYCGNIHIWEKVSLLFLLHHPQLVDKIKKHLSNGVYVYFVKKYIS